jgi:hypothetical protein
MSALRGIMLFRPDRFIGLLVIGCALAGFALGQESKGLERSTTSSIRTYVDSDGALLADTLNRRFTFTTFYTDGAFEKEQFRTLLLLEEFKSTRDTSRDQIRGTVKVEAWVGKDVSPQNKVWAIEQSGDAGLLVDRFYKVTKFGCCASIATDVYFSLLSGQKLYTTNTGLFEVIVPNTSVALTRYVAFHAPDAILPPSEPQSAESQAGVIQYGSEKSVLQRVILRFKGDIGRPRVQMLYKEKIVESEPLMLWGADKKNDKTSLSDFSVVLLFHDLRKVIIPVKNDQLLVSAATVPQGYLLEAVK